MTDPNYTALLIILDRSGSMSSIREDMVGGLEELIASQAAEPGMLTVDIVTFDDQIEHTHSFAQPRDVKVELVPRGSTALYDAVGLGVNGFGQALAQLPEHARPSTVLVTIVTDGQENASREYTPEVVAQLITQQREQYDWEISFLGANQDAILEARKIGIDQDDALTYAPTGLGVTNALRAQNLKSRSRRMGQRTGFTEKNRGDAADGRTPIQ
ncbi:MAG: VWA domain-containing protein [Cryobacterium sp.]|nr:VWA domain-containing protein [Cryobacterium sp.]